MGKAGHSSRFRGAFAHPLVPVPGLTEPPRALLEVSLLVPFTWGCECWLWRADNRDSSWLDAVNGTLVANPAAQSLLA